MKEVGRTFNSGKEIGHLFLHGKEIRKMFLNGDLVYKIGGIERTLLPDDIKGGSLIRIGEYIVLYGSYTEDSRVPLFHRFKDGQYVDTLMGMSYEHQSFLPIYEQGFLGMFALDNVGRRVFYVLSEHGFSNYTVLPNYCPYNGLWFKDRIVLANYTQYVVNSTWDDTLGIFNDAEKSNYLHIPHCLMSIQVSGGTPVYMEHRDYCINLDTEIKRNEDITDEVKDPTYNLDEPIIFSLVKDSGSDRLYGELAFTFCWGYWGDTYWLKGNYEIEDIDFEHGIIRVLKPISQQSWVKAQNYRGIPNCSSYILGSYQKLGDYTVEGDSRNIGGGGYQNANAYFINDFETFANYVLRRAEQNDNGYRVGMAYCYDSVWCGYYNDYYYFINPSNITNWIPEQYKTFNFTDKEDLGSPEYPMAEMGSAFVVRYNAWNDDGIYHLHIFNRLVTDDSSEYPYFKEFRYLYYFTE